MGLRCRQFLLGLVLAQVTAMSSADPIVIAHRGASGYLPEHSLEAKAMAYAQGVPMGGDLPSAPEGSSPTFLLHAAQDPNSNPLQALHLIKGWVDAQGAMHTTVLPVAESSEGAATLCQVFTDPEFDPTQSAYYYMRAVEPATPRWHTYDCEKLPEDQRPAVCSNGQYPSTVNEMAWTSPIWYKKS